MMIHIYMVMHTCVVKTFALEPCWNLLAGISYYSYKLTNTLQLKLMNRNLEIIYKQVCIHKYVCNCVSGFIFPLILHLFGGCTQKHHCSNRQYHLVVVQQKYAWVSWHVTWSLSRKGLVQIVSFVSNSPCSHIQAVHCSTNKEVQVFICLKTVSWYQEEQLAIENSAPDIFSFGQYA